MYKLDTLQYEILTMDTLYYILNESENLKIGCGREHFDYELILSNFLDNSIFKVPHIRYIFHCSNGPISSFKPI